VAFPTLPTLPQVPTTVDADRWLQAYDGHTFTRKVAVKGHVVVDDVPYYLPVALLRQHVALRVDAALGQFIVEADGRDVRRIAIKGVGVGQLPFWAFVELGSAEARTRRSAAYARMGSHCVT
jgi:hypothetical protein